MHLDLGWRVADAQQLIVMEVTLRDAALVDVQRREHQGRQAIDHRSLDLVLGARQVDDRQANVARHHHPVHLDLAVF